MRLYPDPEAAALREHAMLGRYFSAPRTAPYLRITLGTEDDTRRLIAAAVDVLGDQSPKCRRRAREQEANARDPVWE
jgi:histidinol-phosphate/aromatic aminotransferase/cobyric acid decarboxylase-like protein